MGCSLSPDRLKGFLTPGALLPFATVVVFERKLAKATLNVKDRNVALCQARGTARATALLDRQRAAGRRVASQMFGRRRMRDPHEVRDLARECRERAKTAIEPDVIDQLRLWAVELADEADDIERCAESGSAEETHWR